MNSSILELPSSTITSYDEMLDVNISTNFVQEKFISALSPIEDVFFCCLLLFIGESIYNFKNLNFVIPVLKNVLSLFVKET